MRNELSLLRFCVEHAVGVTIKTVRSKGIGEQIKVMDIAEVLIEQMNKAE